MYKSFQKKLFLTATYDLKKWFKYIHLFHYAKHNNHEMVTDRKYYWKYFYVNQKARLKQLNQNTFKLRLKEKVPNNDFKITQNSPTSRLNLNEAPFTPILSINGHPQSHISLSYNIHPFVATLTTGQPHDRRVDHSALWHDLCPPSICPVQPRFRETQFHSFEGAHCAQDRPHTATGTPHRDRGSQNGLRGSECGVIPGGFGTIDIVV